MEPVYATVEAIARPLLTLWYRLDVRGAEHLPAKGPTILACNHISQMDPLAIGWMLQKRGRRARFLTKAELFKNPILRWALSGMGHIPVYRGTDTAHRALEAAEEALAADKEVLIYPEATVGPGLPLLDLKTGAARLSLATGVPITPIGIWGTRSYRPRTCIRIAIGAPLVAQGDAGTLTDSLREALTSLVEEVSCAS